MGVRLSGPDAGDDLARECYAADAAPLACAMTESLGVYVLGADEPGERARMDVHLKLCPICRAVLAELRPLVRLLAAADFSVAAS